MESTKRQIAPRLASGTPRELNHGRLAPAIKHGLRAIARQEGKSMSWVLEEVLIDYFDLRQPRYVKPVARRRYRSQLRRVS
jgi:hypothetical protein